MVFKKCNKVKQFDMFYNNNRLTVVQKFTYLDVTLSSNGLFYQAQKALANQSLKSLSSLNSIFDIVVLETTDKIKLFDSLVHLFQIIPLKYGVFTMLIMLKTSI